jgi:hypothetical protein
MRECNFRRVQKNARRRRAAVKRVAENREAVFRRVNADLMRAAGEWFGAYHFQTHAVDREFGIRDRREFCFRHFSARTAGVFFANTDERGFHGEFFCRHGAVGEQEIFFADAAPVNCSVRDLLASGVLPKTRTPLVSLSSRCRMASVAQRGSRCFSQS